MSSERKTYRGVLSKLLQMMKVFLKFSSSCCKNNTVGAFFSYEMYSILLKEGSMSVSVVNVPMCAQEPGAGR